MLDVEKQTMRKVTKRLLVFLLALYVFNVLDRINLSFAALQMNKELGFSAEIYGLGAGIFFIGYFFFKIPSNYMMSKFGARVWLARIAISWGIVSMLMAFVYDVKSFLVIRFLLGIAEAGLVPGVLLYLSLWVPGKYRASAITVFGLAIPISAILGAPLSGWLLSFDQTSGLSGWQWMFLLEAIPSILLGVLCLFVLVDKPSEARWLSSAEKEWLVGALAREHREIEEHGISAFAQAARDPRTWIFCLTFFCQTMTTYGLTYWLPQIIKEASGLSNIQVGFLTALPFVAMAVGLIAAGWLSDRAGERSFHYVVFVLIAAGGILLGALASTPVVTIVGMSICAFGLGGAIAVFWPIPMSLFVGSASVGGFALINMSGNSAGFVGSYVIGWIRQNTSSFSIAFGVLSFLLLVAAILILSLRFMLKPKSPVLHEHAH